MTKAYVSVSAEILRLQKRAMTLKMAREASLFKLCDYIFTDVYCDHKGRDKCLA